MSLEKRLDKIAATLASQQPARQEIWKCIFGVEDKEAVLDRMVADNKPMRRSPGAGRPGLLGRFRVWDRLLGKRGAVREAYPTCILNVRQSQSFLSVTARQGWD